MNKKDLIGHISNEAHITRPQAARALECFVRTVQSSLVNGDRVTLSGFGTFAVSLRKARMVCDPRSGTRMRIEARRVARFAPGLDLKLALERKINGAQGKS